MPPGQEIVIGGHQPTPQEIAKNKTAYVEEEISRGKPVVALEYQDGILIITENPRWAILGKIFEIYDRIALAAVGQYSEYELLKKDAITFALINGIEYSRQDVKAKDLADRLGEVIINIFNDFRFMPLRVEFMIIEVGSRPEDNLFLRIRHNGAITPLSGLAVIGGKADEIKRVLADWNRNHNPNLALPQAMKKAKEILEQLGQAAIAVQNLEVAVLDRTLFGDRKFRKMNAEEIKDIFKQKQ